MKYEINYKYTRKDGTKDKDTFITEGDSAIEVYERFEKMTEMFFNIHVTEVKVKRVKENENEQA